MRVSRLLAATLLVPVGLVGVTACGPKEDKKSGDAAPAASAPAPASASAPASGNDSLTAAELMKKAQTDSAKVTSVKLSVDFLTNGTHMTAAVAEDQAGNCVGKQDRGDKGSFEMMRSGTTIWVKPDNVFWEKSVRAGSSKLMAGKYLKSTTSEKTLSSLTAFCDLGLQTLKTVGKDKSGADDTARVVKSGTKQIGSVNAVMLTDKDDTSSAQIAIAAAGDAYLLELDVTGADAGRMDFTDFGKPVTVTPPPAAQVVDASQFMKG